MFTIPGWKFVITLLIEDARLALLRAWAWLERLGGEPPEPPTSNGMQVRHE